MAEKMGYDVYLITDSQNGLKPFFPVSEKVKMIDLDINFFQQYQYSPIKRFLIYKKLTNLFKQRISKLLADIKPDVLISTFSRDAKFVGLYQKYAKTTIAEVHTTKKNIRALPELRRKGFPYTWLANFIEHELNQSAKQFDEVIVLNNLEKELWAPVRDVRVINNAVQIYPQEPNPLSAKSAIFVGRAEYEKGPDRLVEVWKLVAEKHPDWTVKMYCTGAMQDDLKAKVKDYGLEKQVLFMPPTKDMEQAYMTSSLCLMTSRFEGFPVVLQEAMGCGVPCLSFNCPSGPRYIITDQEDGVLVENGNIEAMAERACELIENEELRKKLGRKAKENMAFYSEERIMGQWKDLFEELVNRANHGK